SWDPSHPCAIIRGRPRSRTPKQSCPVALQSQLTSLEPKILMRLIIYVVAPPIFIAVVQRPVEIFRLDMSIGVSAIEPSVMALITGLVLNETRRQWLAVINPLVMLHVGLKKS